LSHAQALRSFARRLRWLLAARLGARLVTVWLFIWGVVVLAVRFFGAHDTVRLAMGLLGILPLAALAGWRAGRLRAACAADLRAGYDGLNACGGVIMSEEAGDVSAWLPQLPPAAVPRIRWRGGRALLLLGASALFAATTLLLPDRLASFSGRRPLDIGPLVDRLQADVNALVQERILDQQKANDLLQQLSQLQQDSSSYDPSKTWEALDHIQQSNADAARQAAEEAVAKTAALTDAETLATAMAQAAGSGMSDAAAAQAAQSLESLLNAAKLENGLLNAKIPPELLSGLNGLNKEQLQELLQALESGKLSLTTTVSNLAHLKLLDPAMLAKCRSAGQCRNAAALADYLSTCTNGCDAAALAECLSRGNGGPGGGGPAAPMTWTDGASEQNTRFQEHTLPQSASLAQAQLIGVSRGAPELSADRVAAGHGALAGAAAGGGSARPQIILPEHREAVQAFFKREEQ
jgi:hypothetical protein